MNRAKGDTVRHLVTSLCAATPGLLLAIAAQPLVLGESGLFSGLSLAFGLPGLYLLAVAE